MLWKYECRVRLFRAAETRRENSCADFPRRKALVCENKYDLFAGLAGAVFFFGVMLSHYVLLVSLEMLWCLVCC